MTGQLVSVIIPTFNRAYCIERCVASALAQTHRAVEVIVVDDGSHDGTAALIEKRFGKDPRMRYVYQENRGVSAARNTGMDQSHGEFVAFLDSDDIWKPWKLQIQLAALKSFPAAGMAWSDMEAVDPEGHLLHRNYLKIMYHAYRFFTLEQLFKQVVLLDLPASLASEVGTARAYFGYIYSQMIAGNLVHTSTVLLRRDRMLQIGKFNLDLGTTGEDYDYHLRTCREGPVVFVDLSTITYQTGFEDRLTHAKYHLHIASNYHKTILPLLQKDKKRIHLSPQLLSTILAETHSNIGRLLLDANRARQARGEFLESLKYKLWQPKSIACLLLSFVPRALREQGMSGYRVVRTKLRPAIQKDEL